MQDFWLLMTVSQEKRVLRVLLLQTASVIEEESATEEESVNWNIHVVVGIANSNASLSIVTNSIK